MTAEENEARKDMLEEYDIDKLNPRPNPYANDLICTEKTAENKEIVESGELSEETSV